MLVKNIQCPECLGDGIAKVAQDIIPSMIIPDSTTCVRCKGKGVIADTMKPNNVE